MRSRTKSTMVVRTEAAAHGARDGTSAALRHHQARLARCRRCPLMMSTPVIGYPVVSTVMLVGQAPGAREANRQP